LRRERAVAFAALLLFLLAQPCDVLAFERVGPWSFGAWYGIGVPAAGDINHQLDLTNLALSSAIGPFESMHDVHADLRHELNDKWAVEGRSGYWWKRRGEGLYTRRISALPLELGAVLTTFNSSHARAGLTGAAGLMVSATLAGEDPLGGVHHSGTGAIGELGVTGEYQLSPAWSVQGRFVGRYAKAKGVLPDNGDLDFSGISGNIGLRVSFDTRSPVDSTEAQKKK